MTTIGNAQDWLEQSHQANTPKVEIALLTQILDPTNSDQDLEDLALAANCPALFRCAAIDRYVQNQEVAAAGLLEKLAGKQEPDEDVRFVAIQWLADLKVQAKSPVLVRSGLPSEFEDWRKLSQDDSSERVRWLASLDD